MDYFVALFYFPALIFSSWLNVVKKWLKTAGHLQLTLKTVLRESVVFLTHYFVRRNSLQFTAFKAVKSASQVTSADV